MMLFLEENRYAVVYDSPALSISNRTIRLLGGHIYGLLWGEINAPYIFLNPFVRNGKKQVQKIEIDAESRKKTALSISIGRLAAEPAAGLIRKGRRKKS